MGVALEPRFERDGALAALVRLRAPVRALVDALLRVSEESAVAKLAVVRRLSNMQSEEGKVNQGFWKHYQHTLMCLGSRQFLMFNNVCGTNCCWSILRFEMLAELPGRDKLFLANWTREPLEVTTVFPPDKTKHRNSNFRLGAIAAFNLAWISRDGFIQNCWKVPRTWNGV